jgi:D-glycero-beta-D-manno-heptose-7-phosphate kinase
VDFEQRRYLSPEVEKRLLAKIEAAMPQCQGVILQDYAKGVLSEKLISSVVEMAHRHKLKVLLDPHRQTPINYYRGVDLMTPNYDESLALAGIGSDDYKDAETLIHQVGQKIMNATNSERVVVTLGKRGMRLFESGKEIHLPTFARQVFDVTGAGDTVIATLALAWLGGFTLEQACVAANLAAGVVVGKVGCVPCSIEELKNYIAQE